MTSQPSHQENNGSRQGRGEQELVGDIGQWVISVLRTEPGWDAMVVDFKPKGERTYLRVVEQRDGQVIPGASGPIKQDSSVLTVLEQLQQECYLQGRGSWLSMKLTIHAQNWPQPTYRTTATYNFYEAPHQYAQEGEYTAAELAQHFNRFPRTEKNTPEWAREFLAESGIALEYVPEEQDRSADYDNLHPRLRKAVEAFRAEPGDRAVANVMREALSGTLILDITGSDLVPGDNGEEVGPQSTIRVQTVGQEDGARSLVVYTNVQEAQRMFEATNKNSERIAPVLLRQPALEILELAAQDPQYDEIVIDPASETASMRIQRPQIEWVLASPRNQALKEALLANSMSNVLGALLAPEAQLLLGTRESGGQAIPVMVQPQDPQATPDTLMVFTSAAEVAALDPALAVRSAPARSVLEFAVESGAKAVCVNALPPVATVPTQQIAELLRLLEDTESATATTSTTQGSASRGKAPSGENPHAPIPNPQEKDR